MKKVNYKKIWKKLRKSIKEDIKICGNCEDKAVSNCDYKEALEYQSERRVYEFLEQCMEELEEKEHHNIFTFKESNGRK